MVKGILFQESLCTEPFWMLVACCMVNRTKWQQAEPIFEQIRERWPEEGLIADVPLAELEVLLQPLGLYKRQALSISRMAAEYMCGPPRDAKEVLSLPGCGKYASDSWAIFVEGRRDVEPTDVELIAWLEKNP